MRALITGASGFAGGWLCRACVQAGDTVTGISRRGAAPEGAAGRAVDLRDGEAVAAAVRDARPEVVYHLAALTSVARSWQDPGRTLADNVGAAATLLAALRAHASDARVVWVSSCEVYGFPAQLPITEDAPPAPANPYAVSKSAGEQLAAVYAIAYGLQIVTARPFSHSGPGQLPIFLLSNLTRQAAQGRLDGASTLRIVTGNPDTRRDFTDVRDVARAYRALAAGDTTGTFNVCSGISVSAAEQVEQLARLIAPIELEHVVDPSLVRASEVMELRGDHSRLSAATGWKPEIPFAQTMGDALGFWDHELSASMRDSA